MGALAGMPELGRGLQRAHGRLLPLGWWWLLQARRRGDTVTINGAFVHPDHQDRGAIAVAALPLISGVLADHRWQRIYAAMVEADNVRSRMLAEDALGAVPLSERLPPRLPHLLLIRHISQLVDELAGSTCVDRRH